MKRMLSAMLVLAVWCGLLLYGCGGTVTLTLYFTGDMHGHIVEAADSGAVGLARIAALKAAAQNCLLLDSGDFLHGVPAATLSEGEEVVRLMKLAGYDAAAVGNHEFSYGAEVLAEREAQAAEAPALPLLSANVWRQDGTMRFTPWTTFTVAGVRVGVFGLTSPDTAHQAAPEAVAGLRFGEPVAAAAEAVAALQAQKCALIVALAHLGGDAAMEVAVVDGVDLVIDAHSHAVRADTAPDGTPVVAAGENGQMVGEVAVTFDRGAGAVAGVATRMLGMQDLPAPDAAVQAETDAMQARQQALLAQVVGSTPVHLVGDKETVRTGETNLGNLAADALVWATGADVGLMNGGNIRAGIPAGDITAGQVLEVFPYSNLVVTKAVSGEQLHDIMEHAVGMLPAADGRFAQISGLVVQVDPAAAPGGRVLSMTLASGTPVQADGAYTLATNDFIAAGGDDYPHLGGLPELTLGATLEEVFLGYLAVADLTRYEGGEPGRILMGGTAPAQDAPGFEPGEFMDGPGGVLLRLNADGSFHLALDGGNLYGDYVVEATALLLYVTGSDMAGFGEEAAPVTLAFDGAGGLVWQGPALAPLAPGTPLAPVAGAAAA